MLAKSRHDEYQEYQYEYIELTNGKIFRHSTNYYSKSPYGWNECIAWGGTEL